jgi:hypothetical protein
VVLRPEAMQTFYETREQVLGWAPSWVKDVIMSPDPVIGPGAVKFGKGNIAAKVIKKAKGAANKEGLYELTDTTGKKYVGESSNIPNRLKQHIKSGKIDPDTSVKTTEVLGGKTAREIAEHKKIQKTTGGVPSRFSDKVSNKKDPIGPKRQHLLR